jgi:formyltetrahydrofolate synthetase
MVKEDFLELIRSIFAIMVLIAIFCLANDIAVLRERIDKFEIQQNIEFLDLRKADDDYGHSYF